MNPRFPSSDPANSAKPPPRDPALDNIDWEWVRTMDKLRLVVVAMVLPRSAQLYQGEIISFVIDPLLRGGDLGSLDSSIWGDPTTHFFHVKAAQLATALEALKAYLVALGSLAPDCKIAYADASDQVWRVFYPSADTTKEPIV